MAENTIKLYLGKIQDDPMLSYLRLIVSSLNSQKISAIVKPLIKFGFSNNIIEITKT